MNTKLNKLLAVLLIVMLSPTTLSGCSVGAAETADKPQKDYSNIVENPNISIPGYESLDLKAGTKKQTVDFYNPEENTCFFKVSLVLKGGGGDAKEDVLWTSNYIEPGEHVNSIELSEELTSGAHAAVLKYECFRLIDETPLNGSEIELILNVR